MRQKCSFCFCAVLAFLALPDSSRGAGGQRWDQHRSEATFCRMVSTLLLPPRRARFSKACRPGSDPTGPLTRMAR